MPRFNQYIKKVEHNGIVFDSKEELDYYLFLTRQQEIGLIKDLQVHKSFELIPSYILNGKTIKPLNYEADFVFYDIVEDIDRVIDVKGYADDVFLLKKKLFDYKYHYNLGLEVMKYSKSTGWVNYDQYKKARASYKKRLIEEKNSYKTQLEEIRKQADREVKMMKRYRELLDKEKVAKLTLKERKRLDELKAHIKLKLEDTF